MVFHPEPMSGEAVNIFESPFLVVIDASQLSALTKNKLSNGRGIFGGLARSDQHAKFKFQSVCPPLKTGQVIKEQLADKDQPNFDNLSTAEVAALYQQTRDAARKQRGIQQTQNQASDDLGIDDEYYKDQFGNVIPGKKPPAKVARHYVDASGYVQELEPGESAPTVQGKTLLEKITTFANENAADPEIAGLLPLDETVFETSVSEGGWWMRGDMNSRGTWTVIAQLDGHDDLRFPLSGNLTREEAIESARHHVLSVTDPEPRALTHTELRRVAIQAANSSNVPTLADAVVSYLRLATNDKSITGDYLARPDRRNLIIEALYFCWKNSYAAKGYVESDDALGHINAYLDSRDFPTIQTFCDAWSDFQNHQNRGLGGWRLAETEPEPITQATLDAMSDEELEQTLVEAQRLRSRER
jgi:hypothetical protein